MKKDRINVTKTYLPNKQRYIEYVDRIFNSGWVTNNGQLHLELEKKLKDYLGVKYLALTVNATIGLQIAYKLLDVKRQAITTPFSFVATTNSLLWNQIKPLFVDIDPLTLNIDVNKIEAAITPDCEAIVPVHTYGNGCDVEAIEYYSKKHGLRTIYDTSHCFGITHKDRSILSLGDISVMSLHAAKLFHTVEGGAIITNDKKLYEKAKILINHGISGKEAISVSGTNAKMSEFHAAMGLCNLDDMKLVIQNRKEVHDFYIDRLRQIPSIQIPKLNRDCNRNYSYFPIILPSEKSLKKIEKALNKRNIFPRRYFYPVLHSLPFLKKSPYLAIATDLATRVLCLPLFDSLSKNHQDEIFNIIENNF